MKLNATIKNERGGKKSTCDDTRILVELSYKNKIVGELGLYRIWDSGQDRGYRVVWNDETGRRMTIREENYKGRECPHSYCDDDARCIACGAQQ